MSHTTKISGVKIMSVAALTAAVAELNATGVRCTLEENARPRVWAGNPDGNVDAEFVLRLPDARFDLAFYKQADGSYEPRTDFYGGSVTGLIGAKATDPSRTNQAQIGKLLKLYGVHATMQAARAQGKTVRRLAETPEGEVQLVIEGY